MSISRQSGAATPGSGYTEHSTSPNSDRTADRQIGRWGGIAALAGVAGMVGAVAVVIAMGLPDASDVETLTDFADLESGRIAEHFLYLGALILFALHVFTQQRLLSVAHPAAALFGTVVAAFGYVVLVASSVLHVTTAPLAELHSSPDTPAQDLTSIEYAWRGTQAVYDTMLATGLLLVPIGIILLGIAMRSTSSFGPRLGTFAIVFGLIGTVGAVVEIVDTEVELSALSVLAIVVFHLVVGLRTLKLGNATDTGSADVQDPGI